MEDSEIQNLIQTEISLNKIIIFSKTSCPFCKKAKDKFSSISEKFKSIELDLLGENGTKIQNALHQKTGQRTVPNIFINGKHVGGCDALLTLFENGSITNVLSENSSKQANFNGDSTFFVNSEIANNRVTIFSKTTCPYCTKAKEKFKSVGQDFKAIELDLLGEIGAKIQNALFEQTGQRTVPNIFIKGKHMGGCDALLQLFESGEIIKLLSNEKKEIDIIYGSMDIINSEIVSNKVIIFSKTTCPFSAKAKDKFKSVNQDFKAIELDLLGENGANIQNALFEKTGQKTVPNVFINGKHIGGCDEVLKLFESGEILQLLSNEKLEINNICNPADFVKSEIAANKVIIFSKTTCPYCAKAKDKFKSIDQEFKAIELDLLGETGMKIQNALFEKTGQKTVPNIFINGKHIGGCDAVLKLFNDNSIMNVLSKNYEHRTNVKENLEQILKSNKLVIFGTLTDALKELLHPFTYLHKNSNETETWKQELYERSGKKLSLYIFFDQQYVGVNELNSFDSVFLDIDKYISENAVLIYSKTTCPFCKQAKALLAKNDFDFKVVELDALSCGPQIQQALFERTGQKTVPNIFIQGQHVGGCSDLLDIYFNGRLYDYMANNFESYDYDLCVIGGGSGGISAAKEAASLNKKVALFDFVTPSKHGSVWGLGGTCVNVGCIPKKLFHKASLLNEEISASDNFGFDVKKSFDWSTLVNNVQNYIRSLNNNYVQELTKNKIEYFNTKATFIDKHTIQVLGQEKKITAQNFIIAVGGRPSYPNIPGAHLGITSDDLFSLNRNPGKILLVGASYIALECAGFLNGLGFDTTVMVRSILLRGFDQDIANMIGQDMASRGVKFLKSHVPTELIKLDENQIVVKALDTKKNLAYQDTFNTVVFAIGRYPCTQDLNLDTLGMNINLVNKKIITDNEKTSVHSIFAVGDVVNNAPELTPVAIKAGKLLVRRLYRKSTELMNYKLVPTTVFTPLEYGCIGYSETDAKETFKNVVVYHNQFVPLENALESEPRTCYAKLVCDANRDDKILGFHVLGPNAGEITQGYALGIMLGACKKDFDALIGIHPTCAEVFTTMSVSKESNQKLESSGC